MLAQARRILSAGLWLSTIVGASAPVATADVPHGRDCATATTIELASEVRGAFTGTDDRAVYRFVLEQRGLLDVWVDPWELDLWNVELLDSACRAVPGVGAGDSAIAGKFMSITVPHVNWKPEESVWTLDAGVYFLRFDPNPVEVFGDPFLFRTTTTPHYGHDFKTAQPIAFPSSADGALLYPEDREVFRVTLTEPGVIHAWTTGPADSSASPRINLSFPGFSSPAGVPGDDGTGKGILTRVLNPGDYYLSLEPEKAGVPGPFTLHVEFESEIETSRKSR